MSKARRSDNHPRFGGIVNNGKKPLHFVHIGQRFALPNAPEGFHYERAPNNKLVRRMTRYELMQHRSRGSIMHKITAFRREMLSLMPREGLHPWQKRAEKRRRAKAQVTLVDSGVRVSAELTNAVLRSGR